VIFTL